MVPQLRYVMRSGRMVLQQQVAVPIIPDDPNGGSRLEWRDVPFAGPDTDLPSTAVSQKAPK